MAAESEDLGANHNIHLSQSNLNYQEYDDFCFPLFSLPGTRASSDGPSTPKEKLHREMEIQVGFRVSFSHGFPLHFLRIEHYNRAN